MAADEVWTVRRILDWTVGFLERKGDEHPRLSAEWLLSDATGLSRVELYMNFDRALVESELAVMREGVRRRGAGEPLQYVTGEMPFRHIVLRCERGVLIPRPETEVLVDAALEGVDAARRASMVFDDVRVRAQDRGSSEREALERRVAELEKQIRSWEGELPDEHLADEYMRARAELDAAPDAAPLGVRVLDLCTGTGCIALSIASERSGTYVVATDIDPVATALAERNGASLGLADAVDVIECDLAADVPTELMGTFSVLVSNPPYIPSEVVPLLPIEVRGFEPGLALDGGDDGLDVFRRILELAPAALAPGGMLCVELFEENVCEAANLARAQGGWARVEVREDLTHRPRVLVAVRES